jgi:uncharacterized damage-inducible protein DinB
MNLSEPILAELSYESATARRLLERLPQQQFGWKPHEKSMTLARLATHVVEIPGWVASILDQDEFDVGAREYVPKDASSVPELLQMFEKNIAAIREAIGRQTNERMMAPWRLKKKGQLIFELPRIGMIRSMLINHFIHHRGQLSVYIRLLNVPVPSIYGPSADEPM